MPYNKIDELPENVRHVLPIHAQEIYLKSFNSAHKEYQDITKIRNPNEDLELICYKIAWNAVKHKYCKNDLGKWIEK